MSFVVEFRRFDYSSWYKDWRLPKWTKEQETDESFSWKSSRIEDIYPDPPVLFPTHKVDENTSWDQWWLRHAEFARKGR